MSTKGRERMQTAILLIITITLVALCAHQTFKVGGAWDKNMDMVVGVGDAR